MRGTKPGGIGGLASGSGFTIGIARKLNARKTPSPWAGKRGTGSWSFASVYGVLNNERYRGVLQYGRMKKGYRQGTKVRDRREDKDVLVIERPELAIISADVWTASRGRKPVVQVLVPTPFATRFSAPTYEELGTLELQLVTFAKRFGHLLNVFAAADATTRGKPFLIYHEPMWTMLLDERDMLFIDLASWAKGMHGRGGFLRAVEGRGELGALALSWGRELHAAGGDEFLKAHIERQNAEWRCKAFRRLFPIAVTDTPMSSDVAHLCTYLRCSFDPLRLDRNQHRAHKYEKEKPVQAARLAPTDALEHFNQCRQLIADLRCLASNSSFTSYGYTVEAKADDDEAQDVVDLILCGSLGWIANHGMLANADPADKSFFWQRRQRYYERLHAAHDAAGDPAEHFNNRALLLDGLGRPQDGR